MVEVRLPELGGSVTHAKLTTWLKREGDVVVAGEPIAEVETDKTNIEIEAPSSGRLAKIHVAKGTEGVAINALLASIDPSGAQAAPAASRAVEAPPASSVVAAQTAPAGAVPVSAPPTVARLVASGTHAEAPSDPGADQIAASPLARRMALAAGVSLASISGTGSGGRIMKEDVEAALGGGPRASVDAPAPRATAAAPVETPSGPFDVQTLSAMRRVTAERLVQSKQTIPHFYLRIECAMDRVVRMRTEVNARGTDSVSVTAFVVRAAALALKKVPAANSALVQGALRLYAHADIAVAVNTPSGLIAPVLRRAEAKSLATIAEELRDLAERARTMKLKPDDYAGGSFTISNLGMFGVTGLYPIINPPQSCILGVGALEARPVVRDGAVVVGTMMTATLAADHRAIDGATGAQFLAAFRQFIEDPWALVV